MRHARFHTATVVAPRCLRLRRLHRAAVVAATLPLAAVAPVTYAAAASPPPSFVLADIDLAGAQSLPADALRQLVEPLRGRTIGFDELEALRAAIEQRFHAAGWRLVRVQLPAQTIGDGHVRMVVVELRLAAVNVVDAGDSPADTVIARAARWRATFPMLKEGEPPNLDALDRALGVLREHPSRRAQIAFSPASGNDVVATIRGETGDPIAVAAFADNTGNTQTGRLRYGMSWRHADLFGLDHQVSVQVISAPHDADHPDRLSALPSRNVHIAGLSYRIPFYGLGGALDITAGYSNINSGELENLFTVVGRGHNAGVHWTQQLGVPGAWHWRAQLGYDWRQYDSQLLFGDIDLGVPITLRPVTLGIAGQQPAGTPGATALRVHLALVRNVPTDGSGGWAGDGAFAASRPGAKPGYTLWRFGAGLTRDIGAWQFDADLDGQWSGDLLVPAEQFAAGGSGTVRGFDARGIAGDAGLRARLELLAPVPAALGTAWSWRPLLFVDAAQTWRHRPLAFESRRSKLAAVGAGLRCQWQQLSTQLYVGIPVADGDIKPARWGAVHFSMLYRF